MGEAAEGKREEELEKHFYGIRFRWRSKLVGVNVCYKCRIDEPSGSTWLPPTVAHQIM